ncbi:PASTA domain-containing protein [Streptacidiphilus sp. 4-A2]|nr:PASTA domain-containing protein [Streptacidiphilus sp. 4-A2]
MRGAAAGLVVGGATWALNDALYLTLPNVAGQPQAAATQTLTPTADRLSPRQQFDAVVPAGQAIGTEPGSGSRVRKDSTVGADISKGANRPPVPQVVAGRWAAAKQAITGRGLVGQVTQQPSSAPQGQVTASTPTAGTKEQPKPWSTWWSAAACRRAALPDVVGEPVAQAMSDLRIAGFGTQVNPTYVTSSVPAGSVASQSPSGSSAPAGSTISLTVSSGPPQVAVPDVTGDTEDQARAALTAAGFKVKTHKFLPFGDPTVTTQDPTGGSQAPQGSTVTITLF